MSSVQALVHPLRYQGSSDRHFPLLFSLTARFFALRPVHRPTNILPAHVSGARSAQSCQSDMTLLQNRSDDSRNSLSHPTEPLPWVSGSPSYLTRVASSAYLDSAKDRTSTYSLAPMRRSASDSAQTCPLVARFNTLNLFWSSGTSVLRLCMSPGYICNTRWLT